MEEHKWRCKPHPRGKRYPPHPFNHVCWRAKAGSVQLYRRGRATAPRPFSMKFWLITTESPQCPTKISPHLPHNDTTHFLCGWSNTTYFHTLIAECPCNSSLTDGPISGQEGGESQNTATHWTWSNKSCINGHSQLGTPTSQFWHPHRKKKVLLNEVYSKYTHSYSFYGKDRQHRPVDHAPQIIRGRQALLFPIVARTAKGSFPHSACT